MDSYSVNWKTLVQWAWGLVSFLTPSFQSCATCSKCSSSSLTRRSICVRKFSFKLFLSTGLTSIVDFSTSLCAIMIHSGAPVSKGIHRYLLCTTGFFEKIVTNNPSQTFVCTSFIPHAKSILCVMLAVVSVNLS